MTATKYSSQINDGQRKTYYVVFSFGTRKQIGDEVLNVTERWVEIQARSRENATAIAARQFGPTGWQINGEDGFTVDRRQFYPEGCCLVLVEGLG